ncbi:histone-lysine N-methyltransferase SUVR5-like protein [Medicago truncatula]|uniref:Histone-lysine N-methyltransferase SUVR5-like protein n=2 Tax=Medicago truncatula TaxID=3880 RepID=G7KK41_MEDTR|nr:histone-lysine N-methyltransferase SUVR5-like protein [Medicago truncatula]
MEELICVENRQDDIFKFDEEVIEVQCETSRNNNREEAELSFSEWLEVDEHLAVWFKWKENWHAGIKCASADWPLSTIKAKPTNDNEQNKYIVIFSPETRNYSWVDMLLVKSIHEFPQPIAYETYHEGLKMVQDLTIARQFIMQKLAVEMLYIINQFHLNALIEAARNVLVWKQFAMEASHCRRYLDLGIMVQRLQKNIMHCYIKDNWKLHSSESWAERCQGANNAQTVELLQEELFDSILWNDVHTLRDAPAQQNLCFEWNTWNHDVMKWFSTFLSFSSSSDTQQHASGSDGMHQASLQVGSKRPKLKVHRAYTHSRKEGTVEVPMVTEFPSQLISPVSETVVQSVDSEILFNNGTISRPLDETVVQISEEHDAKEGILDRQCQAYVESKGRQCVRMAIKNDIYCCAHFSKKKEKSVKVLTPYCGGTTIDGSRCKNHSLPSFTFCKKHLCIADRNNRSNSNCHTLKRKYEESCSGQKNPLEIDTVLIIDDDDSFCAKNILGETLMLSGNDHNEIDAFRQTESSNHGNDHNKDSCFHNENINKCKICFEEFANDQTLGDHWMENHKKEAQWLFKSYACALCFNSFTNKNLLESHVQKGHCVKFDENCLLLLCIPCGEYFGNMEELWLHVKSVHPAELKLSKSPKQLSLSTGDVSLEVTGKGNEMGETSMQQPQCLEVANIFSSDIQKTKDQPNNLDILSNACTACCKQNLTEKSTNVSDPASIVMEQDESQSIINSNYARLGSSQKALVLCDDISCGMESTPVICVVDQNILNSLFEQEQQYINLPRPWMNFTYVTKPMLGASSRLDFYEGQQLKCYCSSSTCCCETCDHVYLFDNDYDTAKDIFGKTMHKKFPYDNNGRIILEEGYLVYECNDKCRCDKTCPNRILQNGIRVKLEVFKTEKKGWGVRAGEAISRGTFVCEYIGEVLEEQEAHNRCKSYGEEHCSYFYVVDARVNDMSRLIERQAQYIIDSTRYGNVSRFVNNSCSPNLLSYQVLVESMDCKRSRIGLYASRDIAFGEELTCNYHYELVLGKGSPCLCGSSKCRGRLY